jgi:hypothetical protein
MVELRSTYLIAKCLSNVKATIRRTDAHIDTCTNGIEKRPKSAKNPEKMKNILMKNNGKSSLNTKIDIWVKIMKNRTTEQNLKTNFDLQECLKA